MKRTHYCGSLRPEQIGQTVCVMGWAHRTRDHGGVIFIDLRDREGLVQVVCNPDTNPAAHEVAGRVRSEYVLAVTGLVRARPEGTINPNLATGEVEILCHELEILNEAQTPPFQVEDDTAVSEEVRMRYRYVDLRRPTMQGLLRLRHEAAQRVRQYLHAQGFLEVETPMLLRSTPEGARDFLVPSRLHAGHFYVLPQSPQLLKQTLMVAGVDRYFQLARCLRDEDPRADRQVEHTQIDLEMSFVEQDDVLTLVEGLITDLFPLGGIYPHPPFPRLSYEEARRRFGSDKPDTRFGLELIDVTDVVRGVDFQVFQRVLEGGGQVKGLCVPAQGQFSRKDLDDLTKIARAFGAKGLAWMAVEEGGLRSSILKFIDESVQRALVERMGGKPGDVLLLVADQPSVVAESLGRLRLHLGRRLNLIDRSAHHFLWIVDFPLFEYNADEDRIEPMHHPFTSPKPEDIPLLDTDPLKVRANLYDLVYNGSEFGSGSIRIHRRELQEKVFSVIGLDRERARQRFGFLLEAFEYGAPPHGGIALGFDRIVAILSGQDTSNINIREVIAFPKTQSGLDLMTGAPSEIDPAQLQEVHIQVVAEADEEATKPAISNPS